MSSKTTALFYTPQLSSLEAALRVVVKKMSLAYQRDHTVPPRLQDEAFRLRRQIDEEKGKVTV